MIERVAGRVRRTFGLSAAGLAWVAAAGVVVVGCLAVVASIAEDVLGRDGVVRHDPTRLAWFVAHRSPGLDSAARAVTQFGGFPVLALVAAATGLVLWRARQPLAIALAPALSLAAGASLAGLGKAAFDRARPPAALHLVTESDASFPSGHATDSTALFLALGLVLAVVVLRRPLARVAALVGTAVVAGTIGLSRLVLGVHWPTDVVAGWALGLSCAVVVVTTLALAARLDPGALGSGGELEARPRLRRWRGWLGAARPLPDPPPRSTSVSPAPTPDGSGGGVGLGPAGPLGA